MGLAIQIDVALWLLIPPEPPRPYISQPTQVFFYFKLSPQHAQLLHQLSSISKGPAPTQSWNFSSAANRVTHATCETPNAKYTCMWNVHRFGGDKWWKQIYPWPLLLLYSVTYFLSVTLTRLIAEWEQQQHGLTVNVSFRGQDLNIDS